MPGRSLDDDFLFPFVPPTFLVDAFAAIGARMLRLLRLLRCLALLGVAIDRRLSGASFSSRPSLVTTTDCFAPGYKSDRDETVL